MIFHTLGIKLETIEDLAKRKRIARVDKRDGKFRVRFYPTCVNGEALIRFFEPFKSAGRRRAK